MIVFNKFLLVLFMLSCFLLTSCSVNKDLSDGITFIHGTGEFDKNTLYLKAQHEEKLPENSKQRKDTLIMGITPPNGVFNPIFSNAANDSDIYDAIWDPMLEIDGNGDVVDGIVYLPEIIKEDNTYVFIIKDGVKWQDGTPLTSYDIEFTFKVLMDKTYPGPFERDNFDMLGWREYRDLESDHIEGFKIIDDKKFSIKFNSINAKKLYYFDKIKPLAKHVYGVNYVQGKAEELEAFNKTPFGNGPYKFKEYIEGEEIRLVANENYYKGKPKIENLVYRITTELNQVSLIENGDIDIIRKTILPTEENIKLINDIGFVNAMLTDCLGYGYIAINHKEEIMQDKNLRKALAYGLNREDIVKLSFGDYGNVIDIPQNTQSYFYPEDGDFTHYDYNPGKAKQLLEESGWKVGSDGIREKDGKKLSLKFLTSTANEVNDVFIPIMIKNYNDIGIEVIVEQLEHKTLLQRQKDAKNGDFSYHLALMFTPFSNSDPDASSRFSTNGNANRFSYSNEKVDKLLSDALMEFDNAKRKEIYGEFYNEVSDDLPYIFLFERKSVDIYTSKVKGIENFSLNRWFTKDLEKLYIE